MSAPRSFANAVATLRAAATHFDAEGVAAQRQALARSRTMALRASATLLAYYECLLFMSAYPANPTLLDMARAELRRIQGFLRARRTRPAGRLLNSGLPFTSTVMRFSHDCARWLLAHPDCQATLEEYLEPTLSLNTVFGLTLPLLERPQTTAELSNESLCAALGISKRHTLEQVIAELSRFDDQPLVKDHLYDALGVCIRVTPTSGRFSTAGNQLSTPQTFFHDAPARPFDPMAMMNDALPVPRQLSHAQRDDVVTVIRNAMVLTSRETDPATYMDPRSLRLFDLERGLSVAIFGMTADRQLGLESYVGFTAFKNGMPVSYGGAWVLGQRAEFGMNIFEPYRGGESGFVLCQLLRVYRQSFGVSHIEIDAHQFGLDDPDGINSGAFWFYYKYGFRPSSPSLAAVARREKDRLRTRRGLRTPKSMLRQLTGSSLVLRLSADRTPALASVASRVTRMMQREYQGNRRAAEADCIARFAEMAPVPARLTVAQRRVMTEMAMIARALEVTDARRLKVLAEMVLAKPVDVYRYQQLVTAFFRA